MVMNEYNIYFKKKSHGTTTCERSKHYYSVQAKQNKNMETPWYSFFC